MLDISNAFQTANSPIPEIVCVSQPPHYLDWFETFHPNVPINWDKNDSCLQFMNGIKGNKPEGQKWNKLLGAVVTIMKYN